MELYGGREKVVERFRGNVALSYSGRHAAVESDGTMTAVAYRVNLFVVSDWILEKLMDTKIGLLAKPMEK